MAMYQAKFRINFFIEFEPAKIRIIIILKRDLQSDMLVGRNRMENKYLNTIVAIKYMKTNFKRQMLSWLKNSDGHENINCDK